MNREGIEPEKEKERARRIAREEEDEAKAAIFKVFAIIIITLFVRGRRKLGMWPQRNHNKLALPALVALLPLLVFT
jgi:hypothetical protein